MRSASLIEITTFLQKLFLMKYLEGNKNFKFMISIANTGGARWQTLLTACKSKLTE